MIFAVCNYNIMVKNYEMASDCVDPKNQGRTADSLNFLKTSMADLLKKDQMVSKNKIRIRSKKLDHC